MPSASNKAAAAAPEGKAPVAATPPRPVLFTFQAIQPTWLKKSTAQADALPDDQKVLVPAGHHLQVVETQEVPANAHELVELGHGAGQWHVFAPHFRRVQAPAPAAAPPPALSIQPGLIDWKNFDALVTPNLTVGEVLQFDHRRRPPANSAAIPRIIGTAQEFQSVRTNWGRHVGEARSRLGVTSFHRPEPINQQVGGVPGSFHVPGLAIDLYSIGISLDALYDWLVVRWTGGFGDGRHRGFLHLDRRNGGRFVPGGGVRPQVVWRY
jgi:hypothetical protein